MTNLTDNPRKRPAIHPEYNTRRGGIYCCKAEEFFESSQAKRYIRKVQLIFTSPPFPLNTKKAYGNLRGDEYTAWLAKFALLFKQMLTATGSIVLEMGNAWEAGQPVMSTLALEGLLKFLQEGDLKLAQQFICDNPARLPSPAQWVNVERIRLKDSYTHLWWMAATERPYADNRNVLKPYSQSMLKLLKTGKYNSGKRPSQHSIGKKSFLTNNNGAIPSNVLSFSNTGNGDPYQKYCREKDLELHPARMHVGLPEFFIKLLTKPGDLVFDPFAGSNTTGAAAERLKRRWIAIEARHDYVQGSAGRFVEE
jgi:site-specific DNA-methyltransferase (cytosine-N4-specific)